jgi:DNA-binding beta-propeller fold protein YncE
MVKINIRNLYLICASLLIMQGLHARLTTITSVINSSDFNFPSAIAITSDGTKAYVANFGNPNSLADRGSVDVIDLATQTVTPVDDPYDLIDKPTDLAIYGNTVYVVNSASTNPVVGCPGAGTIGIINIDPTSPSYNTVTGTVTDLGSAINLPNSIAINPTTGFGYVTNFCGGAYNGGTAVINLGTNTITDFIPSFYQPVSIAINVATQTAYTTNWDGGPNGNGSIDIIDLSSNTITGNLSDNNFDTEHSPHSIAVYPSTNSVYMANGNPKIVITATNNALTPGNYISSLLLTEPFTVAINGNTAYVTNFPYNTYTPPSVVIIDLSSNTVIGPVIDPLNSLNEPAAMAFTPNGNAGYIVNTTGGPNSKGSISVMGSLVSILPPSSVSGCKTQNVFLLQTDYINNITWTAPATGSPVAYNIYRDAALTELVATVPASGTLQYYDHGRNPSVIYSYYITSVDGSGNQSTAASVTVTSPC